MNTDALWNLIDAVSGGDSIEDRVMLLADEVRRLDEEELLDFHRLVGEVHAELDNDGLYGAATAWMGFVSLNTVQLVWCDCIGWYLLGLRPGGVVGAFDVPLDVFAFDDAGC